MVGLTEEQIKELDLDVMSDVVDADILEVRQNEYSPPNLTLTGKKRNPRKYECDSYVHVRDIHNLAFEYKEWAIEKGFAIMTSEDKKGVSVKLFTSDSLVKEFPPIDSKFYVFNYCHWIYKHMKKDGDTDGK